MSTLSKAALAAPLTIPVAGAYCQRLNPPSGPVLLSIPGKVYDGLAFRVIACGDVVTDQAANTIRLTLAYLNPLNPGAAPVPVHQSSLLALSNAASPFYYQATFVYGPIGKMMTAYDCFAALNGKMDAPTTANLNPFVAVDPKRDPVMQYQLMVTAAIASPATIATLQNFMLTEI